MIHICHDFPCFSWQRLRNRSQQTRSPRYPEGRRRHGNYEGLFAFIGKLVIVEKAPTLLHPAALAFLSALLPTVHVDDLERVLANDIGVMLQLVFLANSQDRTIVYRICKRLIDVMFSIPFTLDLPPAQSLTMI